MGLIFIFALLLYGCGGGGDTCSEGVICIQPDPDLIVDISTLEGSYKIKYDLKSNSCIGAVPAIQLSEDYTVTTIAGYHAIPTIDVLNTLGQEYQSISYVNNTDGKTYFTVFQVGQNNLSNFIPNLICSESITLKFTNLENEIKTIERISDIDCSNLNEPLIQNSFPDCQVVYEGLGGFAK